MLMRATASVVVIHADINAAEGPSKSLPNGASVAGGGDQPSRALVSGEAIAGTE
jgi:hypothetical protein